MAFQCNSYSMKAKWLMTCLTINLPLEKQYYWISCLSSPKKMAENPNFYLCLSFHLLQKNEQNF